MTNNALKTLDLNTKYLTELKKPYILRIKLIHCIGLFQCKGIEICLFCLTKVLILMGRVPSCALVPILLLVPKFVGAYFFNGAHFVEVPT